MSLSPRLANRRALVTGAASGIGLAVARDLAERGVEVVFSDLPGERLRDTGAGISNAQVVAADLSRLPDPGKNITLATVCRDQRGEDVITSEDDVCFRP